MCSERGCLVVFCLSRKFTNFSFRLPTRQKREIQMAIRKNKETNAVLTRLNSELQQQFKVSPLLSSQSTNLRETGSRRVHVKSFFSFFFFLTERHTLKPRVQQAARVEKAPGSAICSVSHHSPSCLCALGICPHTHTSIGNTCRMPVILLVNDPVTKTFPRSPFRTFNTSRIKKKK